MSHGEAKRPLGILSLTALVVASMIGAGVFTTSGFSVADLRSPWLVMAAWAVGGTIALCGALSYGKLAQCLAESGGEYVFLSRFLHPAAGFLGGWVSLLAGFTGAAAFAAVTFDLYAWPAESRPAWLPDKALAILLVLVVSVFHAFHTKSGAIGQNLLVGIKLMLLATFLLVAYSLIGNWQGGAALRKPLDSPPTNILLGFASSVMWISLSYSGFNAAVYVTEEARGGSATIARAMIYGTVVVTISYMLLNAAFLFAPGVQAISGKSDVAAITAQALAGEWFAWLTRVTICLGLASSVSSALVAGPRVYAKMAADGFLPRLLAAKDSPPTNAVLLQGIGILLVIYFAGLQSLLSYLGLTLSLFTALTVSILFISSNKSHGELPPTVGLLAPSFYVSSTLILAGLAAYHRPYEAIATAVTLLSGIGLYLAVRCFSSS
ncbi:APC family permease [Bythopirellula polymerisocia]|uniref:Serine/threonine exchanger SteT n=1 Tax=Bythopirellula polymerisocia TaxID=2528003 RepID=A0A5C6CX90_9BACT|nr:amino acid permease [Bythopirellula polymerisocia]TWU27646.1 Serine/threonine exchanger SteT [Bythopirellula polymerisocia]